MYMGFIVCGLGEAVLSGAYHVIFLGNEQKVLRRIGALSGKVT